MDGLKRLLIATLVTSLVATGCSTQSVDGPSNESNAEMDDFSDFDSGGTEGDFAAEDTSAENAIENEIAQGDTAGGGDEFSDFEEAPAENQDQANAEFSEADPSTGDQAANDQAGGDEFSEFEEAPAGGDQMAQNDLPPPGEDPFAAEDPMATPEAAQIPPPNIPESDSFVQNEVPYQEDLATAEPTNQLVNIKTLQFRANDAGGTVVVEGDGPMQFQTRMNPDNNQFVIEIPNTKLPAKLKRPLNTRDFGGTIGSIDAYQNAGSTTTRVVVQLRAGEGEPTIQAEGNSLLVVTTPAPAPVDTAVAQVTPVDTSETPDLPTSKLMTSDNLEQFIANNQTFYGKRISIETDEVEIRDIFKMISDEANVNLILAEDVNGKISVKLKNVPWDQALVLIMKTKKLGYTRSGNVLRIASLTEIQKEEKDSFDLQNQRRQNEAPKVRTIQVNYAKVEDLEKQIKNMLSKTGTIVGDPRTSSLIITDYEESIERAVKVVQSLDVAPQQVLIEGKIVEAQEDTEDALGIQWGASGSDFQLGSGSSSISSSNGAIRNNASFNVRPDIPTTRTFAFNMTMGTFDILGDLDVALSLFEREGKVKVLSSPRIVALHNEKANIEQTIQIPIRQTTTTGSSVTETVTFKDVKLALDVTPQLTNDGAVVMKIDMIREFVGSVASNSSGDVPINTRKANTRVIVRNGQTAVIGGIYQNDTATSDTRVPWLGKIPVLGWLFRSQTTSDRRNELLMFLTPRILGNLDASVIPSQTGGSDSGELEL